jgi:hypothetical protein
MERRWGAVLAGGVGEIGGAGRQWMLPFAH